jgi:cbb3-type cytochrome oxidase maturation protein
MESLFLLIPLSLALVIVIAAVFYWSVKNGQFDDMEGPGHSILMDDDTTFVPVNNSQAIDSKDKKS